MSNPTDVDAITECVLDYFEGWFDADGMRMERALHRDLVKRGVAEELGVTTKQLMIEMTERGDGKEDAGNRRIEVRVEDVYGDIASATVHTATYHEYVHLVRTAAGWKIANALWSHS